MADWRAGHAAIAVLSFDVDAESPILGRGPALRRSRDGDDPSGVRAARRRAAHPRAARRLRGSRPRSSSPASPRSATPRPSRRSRGRPRGRPPLLHATAPPASLDRDEERRGLRAGAGGARRGRGQAPRPPSRDVGGDVVTAVARGRVRHALRLDADGRRPALPARTAPGRSPSYRRTGASTTGSSTPSCPTRPSAAIITRRDGGWTVDARARRDAPPPLPVHAHLPPVPAGRAGRIERCAA